MKKKFYKNNVGCYYFYDVSISGKFERIVFILQMCIRDSHTTVMHGVEKIEKELQTNEQLQSTIDTLKKKINPQT